MLTFTFQKVSKISFSISFFFCLAIRPGKGGWIKILELGKAKILLTLLVGKSNDSTSFSFLYWVLVVIVLICTSLPLLRVMTLMFFLGLILAWDGNFPVLDSILYTEEANNDIWFSKFWMLALVSCWKVCVLVAKDFTIFFKGILALDDCWWENVDLSWTTIRRIVQEIADATGFSLSNLSQNNLSNERCLFWKCFSLLECITSLTLLNEST